MGNFTNWAINEAHDAFIGIFANTNTLPAGFYRLDTNSQGQPVATKIELRQDTMYRFNYGPMTSILQEINRFWLQAERYKALGCTHKRGILLYGPPGCGKSAIINCLMEDMIKRNGICVQVGYVSDFMEAIPLLRQIENGRPIMAIFEDIDRGYNQHDLLEALDGASSLGNGIMFVATTNFINKVPARIKYRPSRIDTLLEVGSPCLQLRREYLELICSTIPEHSLDIEYIAEKTENFSLAALKEVVLSVIIYENELDTVLERLSQTAEVTQQVANSEDEDEYDDDDYGP